MEQSGHPTLIHITRAEDDIMKRLFLIALAATTLAFAPTLSASAMPVAPPSTITDIEKSIIQIKGGHGHGGGHGWGHPGGRGHHYGWGRGRGHHYGWRHHRRWW